MFGGGGGGGGAQLRKQHMHALADHDSYSLSFWEVNLMVTVY